MIWLSPMTGTEEGSVYFEIRDISLHSNGKGSSGLVRGLLGDGQREIWGEVELGAKAQVRILPLWTENGQVESLSGAIDEELLKVQLLQAVKEVFSSFGDRSVEIFPARSRDWPAGKIQLGQSVAA